MMLTQKMRNTISESLNEYFSNYETDLSEEEKNQLLAIFDDDIEIVGNVVYPNFNKGEEI